MTCYHMTSAVTLTYTLVVMKHPAGFAVQAFVVLRPWAFLTWVVTRYKEWKTRREWEGQFQMTLKRTEPVKKNWTTGLNVRHLHTLLRCCWSFSLWSSRPHNFGTEDRSIQDHRHTLHPQGESPPPRSGPDHHTRHQDQMDTLHWINILSVRYQSGAFWTRIVIFTSLWSLNHFSQW